MLDDLDKTLRKLLTQEVPDLDADQVSFEAPGADFKPGAKAVNLFLYDVRENTELRDNNWQLDRQQNGGFLKKRAPRRIDCSYLITAWAGDPLSEHLLLGQVMQALLRSAPIPLKFLEGALAQQDQPLPASLLQPATLQSIGEFWQAMDNKPRAALNYTVTISVDVFVPIEVPAVTEKVFHTGRKIDEPTGPALAEQSREEHVVRLAQRTGDATQAKEE